MCGRLAIYSRPVDASHILKVRYVPQWKPRFNIAPGSMLPVITGSDTPAGWARWGFAPRENASFAPINARIETVFEKPFFRDAARHRRCLVPFDGYYEWEQTPNGKQPWFISGGLCALAGIVTQQEGNQPPGLAIVTRPAHESIARIHHRMPVMLAPEHIDHWLTEPANINDDMLPKLTWHKANRDVNNPSNNHAGLCRPM